MKRIVVFSSILLFFWSVVSASAVFAQTSRIQPDLNVVVAFQKDSIRLNEPLMGSIWVSNQSDVPVEKATLFFEKPEFILLHIDSCENPVQAGPVDLGALPPRSVTSQPVNFCLTLDRQSALSGKFNILVGVLYSWEQGADLLNVEKTLSVDLIGTDTILGIPLGFAGFVLPGLMLLVALRWFGVPVTRNLEPIDRLIYGILLSLILLGPFSWLATQPGMPTWLTWLDFQQQVSIERLAIFILVGLTIGLMIGSVYKGFELQKERQARLHASLQIKTGDKAHTLIRKALLLNPKYDKNRLVFHSKNHSQKIYGYHFAVYEKSLYVFAHFQLIINLLPDELQTKVRQHVNRAGNSGLNGKNLLAVLSLLDDRHTKALIIANPVQVITLKGESAHAGQELAYMILDQEEYLPPQADDHQAGCLLEVLDEMPY